MLKILVVDDHPIVRQGVKQIIAETSDMEVAGEASDGDEALNHVKQNSYDIVILDISMPGKSGLETIKEIKEIKPDLPILILTMHPEKQFAVRLLQTGASGYLTKDKAPSELINALSQITQGKKYVSSDLISRLADYLNPDQGLLPHESLSRRESQIMKMIAAGKTITEIAQELCLSVKTISTHRTNILKKMNMKKNVELVHYAIQNNLINW